MLAYRKCGRCEQPVDQFSALPKTALLRGFELLVCEHGFGIFEELRQYDGEGGGRGGRDRGRSYGVPVISFSGRDPRTARAPGAENASREGASFFPLAPIAVAGSLRRLPTRPKQPGASKGTTTSFTAPAY
jgi:hypothetical protein